jgi:hypothetical protein
LRSEWAFSADREFTPDTMATHIDLSENEFAALQEVARGFDQRSIPESHRRKLIDLRLIYKLLGGLRMTAAGRRHLASHA